MAAKAATSFTRETCGIGQSSRSRTSDVKMRCSGNPDIDHWLYILIKYRFPILTGQGHLAGETPIPCENPLPVTAHRRWPDPDSILSPAIQCSTSTIPSRGHGGESRTTGCPDLSTSCDGERRVALSQ